MDILTIILQLLFGWAVKKVPALSAWPNKLIPLFNAILAALVQVTVAATAHAQALGADVPVHHGHPAWFAIWAFVQPVLLNTLVSTGIFSTGKNAVQHITK